MKKKIGIITGITIGLFIFIACCRFLDTLLVEEDAWHKILFHSYYTQDKNIDNAFIGSSHVLCDVEPKLLDELNGKNNFNMSSPQQRYDTSYYLLKQMAEDNKLEHVYLECYYLCVTDHEIWDKAQGAYRVSDYIGDPDHFASAWLISYAMKPSINKYAIQFHASDKDHTIENILPFVRYRQKLFDWPFMENNLKQGMSEESPSYTFHIDYEEPDGTPWCQEYHDKGDNYSDGRVYDCEKVFPTDRDLTKYGIGARSEEYLKKCIEYCRSKNIPVTVFVSPVLDFQLLSTGDYDSYVRALRELTASYGVDCYDFNLIKKEYLDIKHGDYYMDPEHLNAEGATMYTKVLWDVLSRPYEQNQDKFHDTYAQKFSSEDPEIYGLYYSLTDPGDSRNEDGSPIYETREYTIASNRDDMEYRITNLGKDEEGNETEELIQDYGSCKTFSMPVSEHGSVRIEGRYLGTEGSYQGQELELAINY